MQCYFKRRLVSLLKIEIVHIHYPPNCSWFQRGGGGEFDQETHVMFSLFLPLESLVSLDFILVEFFPMKIGKSTAADILSQ